MFFIMFPFYCKVWTLTLCIKHYNIYMTSTLSVASIDSVEVTFDHFLIHLGISRLQLDECWFLSAQELTVYLHKHGLSRSPNVQWCQIARSWWPVYITTTRNYAIFTIFAPIVWHVAPSCGNHIFSKSYSSIAGK